MKREDHEALLQELLGEELETSRKTEILQSLREDNGKMNADFEATTESLESYKKKHADLVDSNSRLFRELGSQQAPDADKEEMQEKERSETITLEDLEGGNVNA